MPNSEAQLQRELQSLFDLDTPQYLQLYVKTLQQLQETSWKEDIQQIYRCVHTIKGGAATVGARAILQVANVLEDLLSDLRYIEPSPPLADGNLQQILLEAGELLIGSMESSGESIPTAAIARIEDLHSIIKQTYLPEWNEQSQLHQEFAEQGFDLVVLDLDMVLEQLPATGVVPTETVEIAQRVMHDLQTIGSEQLGFADDSDWAGLIAQSQSLLEHTDSEFWQLHWQEYLRSLKNCAKHSGTIPAIAAIPVDPLQQELRELFDLDTQKSLQQYINTLQTLDEDTWKESIQQLYRSVHTIKGGAVTVGANAILQVATALEDLLSDLRYLDIAPPLADGTLNQILVEAGELLIGSLPMGDREQPTASVNHILGLRAVVQESYTQGWDEQSQLASEFAEQGFDLVVLELEMAIEQLMPLGSVPPETLETARQIIAQLEQIGTEIDLAPDWSALLVQSQSLLENTDNEAWIENWPPYLRSLKQCAKNGGRSPIAKPTLELLQEVKQEPELEISAQFAKYIQPQSAKPVEASPAMDIQIPVPLERLDRSAQQLVETLMATRATQGFYQSVHSNLMPLVALAQDSVQYISRLREVQDDYALIEADNDPLSPKVERYRQGYTAINRLLEISLRLIELGAETGESARRTSESLQRLDLSLRGLQQTLEESRLVPFESLSFRARGILRDLTVRLGKPAQLTVSGEKLELDAGTLRSLEPVLLHLIRNAYDHGLELTTSDRLLAGKPEQGTIQLALSRRGSVFVLDIKDDGRGIDPENMSRIATNKSLPLTNTNTPAELLAVICQPGFTSASSVTDVSGRGVGMDVVFSQVAALNGQLSLNTQPGMGTTFTIAIPVPHLFVRCMLIQAGDRTFAIPTAEVFTTMLLDDLLWQRQTETTSLSNMTISEDTGDVPALDIYQYWQGESTTHRALMPTSIAVRTKRSGNNEGIWLVADNLVGQNDLLVNSLPSPLLAPIGIMGVSLQADGKLIPVIDPTALIDALLLKSKADYLTQAIALTSPQNAIESESRGLLARQILVVDDAALMRRRIESSLSAQGYDTRTCSDGLEAWDWIQTNGQPTLLITDIEMPGMDGFTLIDRCRQAGLNMPILVISSRLAEEWSKETRRLGATDYLTKGFATPELLDKVATLLEQPLAISQT
jgi:chemotaxis protein histidine kinase CheA